MKTGQSAADVGQIDTPYLTETTSGLTYAVDRFRDWAEIEGDVTAIRQEGDGVDAVLVALEEAELAAALQIPEPDRAVP